MPRFFPILLLLNLVAILSAPVSTPAAPDFTADDALEELAYYMERTWLLPNGLDFQYMEDNQPVDMAVLLGLTLRTQTPHVERDPSLQDTLWVVADEMRGYLRWLAGNTKAATDPWGNPLRYETLEEVFTTAVMTTDYDQYSINVYGVDPMPLVYDDQLTPLAQALGGGQQQTPPSAKYEARDDENSINLLNEEAQAAESDALAVDMTPAQPQPEPEPVTIDPIQERDILGNWRHKKTGMLLVIQPGKKAGTYEGRFPNAQWEDWGEGLEFFTNNFQLQDSVLRIRFKQDTGWGLSYDGRLYGANDWDYPLTVNISRNDENRLVLGYSAVNLNGGPYIRD